MKLIVGLGNPGKEYEKTRHNVGFLTLDAFCKKQNLVLDKHKCKAEYGKIILNSETLIICKPETYMNLSGEAVSSLAHFYQIEPSDILVIYDDMDLPIGKLRLRKNGSGGSHNGIKNIVKNMNTTEIKRIRIGIGKNKLYEQKDYVLGKFSKDEEEIMNKAFDKASDAIIDFSKHDFEYLMNKYNQEEL